MGNYPGYAGVPVSETAPPRLVGGLLLLSSISGGLAIEGTLVDLEASVSGGWHVHVGSTCDTPTPAADIGGHERAHEALGRIGVESGVDPAFRW